MSKVLRLVGRTFHRDTVYEIRCANCGREYESTCSRKEAEALRYCNECSGGDLAGRAFHGRPMAASNHKLAGRRP